VEIPAPGYIVRKSSVTSEKHWPGSGDISISQHIRLSYNELMHSVSSLICQKFMILPKNKRNSQIQKSVISEIPAPGYFVGKSSVSLPRRALAGIRQYSSVSILGIMA
jgi:hypothetical protein